MHDARHDPAGYDLRAPADLHPLTDIDALRQLCHQQAEAITYLVARVTLLETHVGSLMRSVDAHGDALQLLKLRGVL